MRASSAAKRWRQRPAQAQAQDLLATVGAADSADDEQPGAQGHQARRLIVSNLAFEVGAEVEEETEQAAATVLVVKWEGCPQGPQAVGLLERSRLWTCGQPCTLRRRDMAASRQFAFLALR